MSVLGSVILGLLSVLDFALGVYKWLVIAAALLSWVRPDPRAPVVRFIYSLTDPVIYWLRRNLPTAIGGLDLSPLILIFGIHAVQRYALPVLAKWAAGL